MSSQSKTSAPFILPVIIAMGAAHLCNDLLQSVIPAMYPILKENYNLTFSQIGWITFAFQATASLFQPAVGFYTDKHPQPWSFIFGMTFTSVGIILLSFASSFEWIIFSVSLVGLGSSIFHPEASRVAFSAAGPRRGLAQSLFQLGGNSGSAIGPLLVALILVPRGQYAAVYFLFVSLIAYIIMFQLGKWYKNYLKVQGRKKKKEIVEIHSKQNIIRGITVLLILIFSKYFYMAGISSYLTFYLIEKFQVSTQNSQIYLFVFMASTALGTLLGGPLGDKYGRKSVIWFSILGAAPFALILPHVGLITTIVLLVLIGLILSSAFSAILVYAQELLPGREGMVSGLFFGFAFGMGGLGSAVLGKLADMYGIEWVYGVCAFLPLLGILTVFLPKEKSKTK